MKQISKMDTNVRICENLRKLLEEIIKIEKERGIKCSYRDASEILYKRIINAGGLRKD